MEAGMEKIRLNVIGSDKRMTHLKRLLAPYSDPDGRPVYIYPPNVMVNGDELDKLSPETNAVILYCRGDEKSLRERGLLFANYMDDEDFTIKNAALTAEAALKLIMESTDKGLYDLKILIVGFGRIGAALSGLLYRLGVDIDIATGSSARQAAAFARKVIPISSLDFSGYDIVVSTVPKKIAEDCKIYTFKENAIFIDLAGEQGINMDLARYLSVKADYYPALPAKYSPETAAAAMKDVVLKVLNTLLGAG